MKITPSSVTSIDLDNRTFTVVDDQITAKININREIYVDGDNVTVSVKSVEVNKIKFFGYEMIVIDDVPYIDETHKFVVGGEIIITPADVTCTMKIIDNMVLSYVHPQLLPVIHDKVDNFRKKYHDGANINLSLENQVYINKMLKAPWKHVDHKHTLKLVNGYRVVDTYDNKFVEVFTHDFDIIKTTHYTDNSGPSIDHIYKISHINIVKVPNGPGSDAEKIEKINDDYSYHKCVRVRQH